MTIRRKLTPLALIGLLAPLLPAAAQQAPAGPDSSAARRDYASLSELLAALPDVAAPAFNEERALWLGSLPLACLDRLQARPGRAGGSNRGVGPGPATDTAQRGARGGAPIDSAARPVRASGDSVGPQTSSDSAGRGEGGRGRGTLSGADYFWVASYRLIPNHKSTRAFWGCTDWHSAVSSTWVTARLLRQYPAFRLKELSREKLNDHLGKTNLDGEFAFFRSPAAGSFERPYGYAWLLKLYAELRTSPDSQAKSWATNVAPLATWMADRLAAHIRALARPVRTGSQANTALVLSLALDYADGTTNAPLRAAFASAARKFYLAERACDTQSESVAGGRGTARGRGAARGGAAVAVNTGAGRAQGAGARGTGTPGAGRGGNASSSDILSPCLAEAALMSRVLTPVTFAPWLDRFLPPLHSARFAPLTEAPGAGSMGNERTRLSALAFQRAYGLERIARGLPSSDARVAALRRLSAIHAARGFELMRDDITGTHWLPAYALLYITARRNGG
jgi:DUF2891 family protein